MHDDPRGKLLQRLHAKRLSDFLAAVFMKGIRFD